MSIELYLLDFETSRVLAAEHRTSWHKKLPAEQFPILPYRSASKILRRKSLSAEEKALLLPSLQQILSAQDPGGGAACHYPIHGLRIWDGSTLVFQTSFCYMCDNYYVGSSTKEANWVGLADPGFQKLMEQLLPIPKAELDRFNAKYRPKE